MWKSGDVGIGGRIILKWVLREIGCENVYTIHLTQDRSHWEAVVNMVLNILILQKAVNFLTS
jgi:hypothetical protein